MKYIYILFLLLSSLSYSQQPYYDGIDFNQIGLDLKTALANKISSNNTPLPYSSSSYDTWDALKETDKDPDNSSNVLLIYNSSSVPKDNTLGDGNTGPEDWNREHVFARALAGPSLETNVPGPGTDIHNLRASNPAVNSDRGSLKFADGNGTYGAVSGGWYPGDDWKGDVARIIMYMYVRYDGDGTSVEETYCWPSNVGIGSNTSTPDDMIDLFLQWNADDEVSAIEMQRNTVSENRVQKISII
ncbi:MAG: endonuclease [Flavobacteriaceae bacterium]